MPAEIPDEYAPLVNAMADGSYAQTFTGTEPPKHYGKNERWAWDLGWRLQQFLLHEASK